jgi:hypothetical protein
MVNAAMHDDAGEGSKLSPGIVTRDDTVKLCAAQVPQLLIKISKNTPYY